LPFAVAPVSVVASVEAGAVDVVSLLLLLLPEPLQAAKKKATQKTKEQMMIVFFIIMVLILVQYYRLKLFIFYEPAHKKSCFKMICIIFHTK
jgi:hypothetical protein